MIFKCKINIFLNIYYNNKFELNKIGYKVIYLIYILLIFYNYGKICEKNLSIKDKI